MQERGPAVYRPYPRRLERLTLSECHSRGCSTFSLVIIYNIQNEVPPPEGISSKDIIAVAANLTKKTNVKAQGHRFRERECVCDGEGTGFGSAPD